MTIQNAFTWPPLEWNGFTIRVIHVTDDVVTMGAFIPATPVSQETAVFREGRQIVGRATNLHDAAITVRDRLAPFVPQADRGNRLQLATGTTFSKSVARRLATQCREHVLCPHCAGTGWIRDGLACNCDRGALAFEEMLEELD